MTKPEIKKEMVDLIVTAMPTMLRVIWKSKIVRFVDLIEKLAQP